jgi:hypothetical protein
MNPSDETLGAYVDGELDTAQRAQVEAAIACDVDIAKRVERLRAVLNQLLAAFSSTAQEPVPQRLLDTAMQAPPQAAVADLAQARAARQPVRNWQWGELSAIAATLVVVMLFGYFLLRSSDADLIVKRQGVLLARGTLAEALSTQLASEQARDATVRIGLSFRDKQGDYCRTFAVQDGRDLAGLACRESAGWHVQTLVRNEAPIGGSGGPEPAGNALPAEVLRAVEEKITGEPLDTAGEAAALRSKWGAR